MRVLFFMLSCLCGFSQNPADLMATYQVLYPTQVAGLSMWLKADSGCYSNAGVDLCTDGVGCQRWIDQSGTGNDVGQVTFINQPKYKTGMVNGLPALVFGTGTTRTMTNTLAATLNQPNTMLVVFYPSNNAADCTLVDGLTSSTGNKLRQNTSFIRFDAGTLRNILNHQPAFWHQVSCQYNGAFSFGLCDAKTKIGNIGSAGTQAPTGFRIGSTYVPDQTFQGMIAEIQFYNRKLTIGEIYGLEMGLKLKYAIPDPF